MTPLGHGCNHQNPVMLLCQEARLKLAFGLLFHAPGTVFLQLFMKPKPFLLSRKQLKATFSVIPSNRDFADSEH